MDAEQPGPFVGDACQDSDNDGHNDDTDNCVQDSNVAQLDSDNDGLGNKCDDVDDLIDLSPDVDGDGVPNEEDNCPTVPQLFDQDDSDSDDIGDACDPCPLDPSPDCSDPPVTIAPVEPGTETTDPPVTTLPALGESQDDGDTGTAPASPDGG